LGWSVTQEPLTSALIALQGHSASGINALAQAAGVAALELPAEAFRHQLDAYRKRRDLALEILRKAGKIELFVPQGAFYFFLGVGGLLQGGEDSIGFAERLLQAAKVATVPGTPFGEPEYLRISFATDERSLAEGCRRIVSFVQS
jgi:aspartate aminotransferase